VFFLVTALVFVLMRLTPGDPVQVEFGIEATPRFSSEAPRARVGPTGDCPVPELAWADGAW
jgi:ABC-type dipeptide/oligopeptide/nickel transport system permease component